MDLNFLPNDKIFDWSRLKAFADDKTNVTEKIQFVLGRVENIVGKEENAGCQHFLPFPQCFQKATFSGSLKVGLCGKDLSLHLLPNQPLFLHVFSTSLLSTLEKG